MIKEEGIRDWDNIHVTQTQHVEMINIDNSNDTGLPLGKYEILEQTTRDINALIQKAKKEKKKIRAIGSGWALSTVQLTDNWLINTKLLNECFELEDEDFHVDYAEDLRKLVVIAQCGVSIGELNLYLELPHNKNGIARSLSTAGIGAGQTIVGAVSGNTHGAAVNFGAVPDFVIGIQLCNGTDRPLWIERASSPILNDSFVDQINCRIIRDDNIFNSVIVSFGACGVITAFAVKTEPIYYVKFPKIEDRVVTLNELSQKVCNEDYYEKLQHLEFVFNPYADDTFYLIEGIRVSDPGKDTFPKPLWIVTNKFGIAPGDTTPKILLNFPLIPGKLKSKILFKNYLKNAVLTNVTGTSGQLYTATITYLQGYNETAFAVSNMDIEKTIEVVKQATKKMGLPSVFQARVVKPGAATFGFTNHSPRCIVFEFGIVNTSVYPKFEELLIKKLKEANIRYTLHWSKNSMVNEKRLLEMYGANKIKIWKDSRKLLFDNDQSLAEIFNNIHLRQSNLDSWS
jgi:hypothetical protein